jgi:hypothetical protein
MAVLSKSAQAMRSLTSGCNVSGGVVSTPGYADVFVHGERAFGFLKKIGQMVTVSPKSSRIFNKLSTIG